MQCASRLTFLLAMAMMPSVLGCTPTKGPVLPARPAEKPKNEAALAYTTLTAKAHQALQIEAAPVNNARVQEHLHLTGWIMARPGNEVTITAPVSGHVRQSSNRGRVPFPGEAVAAGRELFQIDPVLGPVEKFQLATLERTVQNELNKASNSLKVAEQEFKRMQALFKEGLRGEQDIDQAKLKLDHALEDLKAAQDKQHLFRQANVGVAAPRSGTILAVHASPGQYVTAAAPLLTLADLSELWIRAPVPEYDLAAINDTQPVLVMLKTANGRAGDGRERRWSDHHLATPIGLAPSVDPLRHTADLHYRLSPFSLAAFEQQAMLGLLCAIHGGMVGTAPVPMLPTRFVKDQMVSVHVPVGRLRDESVAPYSAVVFDAFGGAWIYLERTPANAGEHQFERRRVELGAAVDGGIVLRPALLPGTRIVTSGAAVLYSREYHKPPVADAD